MDVSSLANVQSLTETRGTSAKPDETPCASFQVQLESASAGASERTDLSAGGEAVYSGGLETSELLARYEQDVLSARSAASLDHSAFVKDDILSDLNSVKLLLLERMEEGKKRKEEQEEWEHLLKCLDKWIEALRAEIDGEKKGRTGGVMTEGGGSLLALYEGLISGLTQADDRGAGLDPAEKELLDALIEAKNVLQERLRADGAAEEDQEEWIRLLRRLDKWIEALREEIDEEKENIRLDAGILPE